MGYKMIETSEQLRAARAALGWTQKQLSDASGVGTEGIKRIEGIRGPIAGRAATISALQSALEAAGVVFIPSNGGPAGVRYELPTTDETEES